MRKLIKTNIMIWMVCIVLCGCTRREQLVLEDVRQEQDGSGQQSSQGDAEDLPAVAMQEDPLEQSSAGQYETAQEASVGSGDPQSIYVHVCGAVENPDVYELPVGSRVYEAVQAAGGFAEDADSSYVNQAQRLSDGVKLVIPTREQTQALAEGGEEMAAGIVGEPEGSGSVGDTGAIQAGAEADASWDGRVNINTASEAELCNIPGIGAVRAAAIVAYRQEKGGFASVEDIMNVSGIKEGTYEKIKDNIKVK